MYGGHILLYVSVNYMLSEYFENLDSFFLQKNTLYLTSYQLYKVVQFYSL